MMKRALMIALVMAAASLTSGCDGGDTTAPAAESVYRHAMDGVPTTLDPVQASTVYNNFLVVSLYHTLYAYKYLERPFELIPNLAAGMPEVSDDQLTYTIRLQPGARFMDDPAFEDGRGREVTAQDFVYSIKRHFDPKTRPRGAWLWADRIDGLQAWGDAGADYDQPVAGLQALDDHTIRIQLLKPFPQLIHTLTQGYSAIVPREAAEHYGRELAINPVGSGPYQLVSFTSAKAVMSPNPNYPGQPVDLDYHGYQQALHSQFGVQAIDGASPPFVDRVEIHFIPEDAARWNALLSGNTIDFIRVPATQFGQVLESRDPVALKAELSDRFHHAATVENGFVRIDFDMANPAIGYHQDPERQARNKALRCAIIKAFDWQARNEAFYYGMGEVFPGVIPPAVPEFEAALPDASMARDVDGARRLLQEAGWTADNLPVLEYGFNASVTNRQFYEQLRGFLGDIGYPPEKIKALTFATFGDYARAVSEGRVMMMLFGWVMDYPDAENTTQLFYGPNRSPGPNSANFSHAEYDALFEQAGPMPTSARRADMLGRMNQIIVDECVSITGISRAVLLLWDQRVNMYPDRSVFGGHFLKYVHIPE